MISQLNPCVLYAGAVKVGFANTHDCVGRENRIFYFTSGDSVLVIDDKPYTVSKNTLAYVPSYTKYRFEFDGSGRDVALICLNFDVCAKEECNKVHIKPIEVSLWDGSREGAEKLPHEFSSPIVISGADGVQKDVEKITKLFFNREQYFEDFASVYMKKILLFALTRSVSEASPEPAVKILEYIRDNYNEQTKNSELARLFNYHPNHLNRVVKAYTGMPLKSYIIAHRIKVAKEMLATTDQSITEISENCGFSTPSYFTELFSRSEGMTPREYRGKIRSMII